MMVAGPFEQFDHRPVEEHEGADEDTGKGVKVRRVDFAPEPEGEGGGRGGGDIPELVPTEDPGAMVVAERTHDAVNEQIADETRQRRRPGQTVYHQLRIIESVNTEVDSGQTAGHESADVDHD